jgi:hypothetical protein
MERGTAVARAHRHDSRAGAVRRFVGGFYLVMGGINAGIVVGDPETYRTFADGSWSSFVTEAWHDVVMAHPLAWILLLAAGEVTLGVLLLRGGPAARAGWVGVVAFHVLLMSFGFGFCLWSVPALAVLVPSARADWPALATSPAPRPRASQSPSPPVLAPGPSRSHVWTTAVLAAAVLAASAYGLLVDRAYRGLPDATVLGARAQDACSIVVAVALVVLVARPASVRLELVRLGLLAYLAYSYLIYVSGVPMNRVFLAYVVIVALSGAGLLSGLARVVASPPPSSATRRLRRGTGWMLAVTGVLFAGLWLSTLLPFALGGARPDPEGVGGTPYPVFWLDLAIVLPLVVTIGALLLRGHRAGPALAVVALIKVVTLFTALWAGPLVATVSGDDVHLGPDAGPSLLLLVLSGWLVVRWLRSLPGTAPLPSRPTPTHQEGSTP